MSHQCHMQHTLQAMIAYDNDFAFLNRNSSLFSLISVTASFGASEGALLLPFRCQGQMEGRK